MEVFGYFSINFWYVGIDDDIGQKEIFIFECDLGSVGGLLILVFVLVVSIFKVWFEQFLWDQVLMFSDEEDIYVYGFFFLFLEVSVIEFGFSCFQQDLSWLGVDDVGLFKLDQFVESWMGYLGFGYGIFSLVVLEKYIWCLDYKGGLFCSVLLGVGLCWQKFEDVVQQVVVLFLGVFFWKIEQKFNWVFVCGKVIIKGKWYWYEVLFQVVFVVLSDDIVWIIRISGDLYLQIGLSVDCFCVRVVKVDCFYLLFQIIVWNNVVWVLIEQRVFLYWEGVSSFCLEGEQWKCDIISER